MTQRHADQSAEAARSHRKPVEAPQAVAASGGPAWETLQRALGNQGTQRATEREAMRVEQQRAERESVTPVSGDTQMRIDALSSASTPIDTSEASFRVGPEVDRVAHDLGARAFTQGKNVFLGARGRDSATVAHELTHVSRGQTGPGTVQRAPEEPEEIEMEAMYVGRDPQLAGAADATTPPPADPITGGEATQTSVQESTTPQVEAPAPAPDDPARAKAVAEAEKLIAEMNASEDAQKVEDEAAEADEPQVSMTIPAPGEKPTYVKKPKKPAPAPHETLDPRTKAVLEGKKIMDDTGQMVDPLGPINRQERIERAWSEAKWEEQFRRKKNAEAGKDADKPFREGVAVDLIGGAAPEVPFQSTPSTGGEPEPTEAFPTLKVDKPEVPEKKPEPLPLVPQKFSFSLTIDKITKEYKDLTAEETIELLKLRWMWVRSLIDIYKKWHQDILDNRDDHPVVGFIVDLAGRRDPPDIRIWDNLENDLGGAIKAIDLDIPNLRSDFEAKERAREERERRDDAERVAEGGTSLLKFRGINPKWATREDWEEYMKGHIGGAVQSLQSGAHRVESRRKTVFYYKEKTIETTEDAVKVLQVAKKAGAIAASLTPVGRGLGLLSGAVVSAGVSTAYNATQEFAGQASEIVFSDRTEFDFAKIGKNAVKDAVVGFVGGMAGGALGRYLGGALARRFGGRLSKEAIGRIQIWLIEPASNVVTSPLTTTTRVVFERAVGDRKTLSAGTLIDEIVNGLPEDAIMGFVGSRVTARGHATMDAPTHTFGYTTTAPTANIYGGGQPSPGVVRPPAGEPTAPVPVAEGSAPLPATGTSVAPVPVAEAPRALAETPKPVEGQAQPSQAPAPTPQVPTPIAPAPAPQLAPVARQTGGRGGRDGGNANDRPTRRVMSVNETPTRDMRAVSEPATDANLAVGDRRTTTRAVPEDAQSSTRTEPSDAELAIGDRRTTTRAVPEDAQSTRRTEPSDAELAIGDRRTTTRAVPEDAQSTRRTEPSDAELAIGDRRTTTRAVPEDAQSTRRTEPSDAELAVGDQRTTTRAVDEGPQRQRAVDEPDATRGPIQPGVRDLPPGSVHRDLTYIEAYRSYNASVRQNPRFEAGIWRNNKTGEYVVVEGQREYVDPGQLFRNPDFQVSKGQAVDGTTWHMVEHFHPGWGDRRQFYNRFPSPEDFRSILESQTVRGTSEAVRSQIRAKDPVTGRDVITEYGYDPSNTAEPFYIRYKDQAGNTVEKRFKNETPWDGNSDYRKFVDGQRYAEPQTNFGRDDYQIPADEQATGVWRTVEPPVVDASVATPPRSTLPMNVDTTQRAPDSGTPPARPGGATQRGVGVPNRTAGPADATQRVPVQGPGGATQRMTSQGPVDSNPSAPDMPGGVGSGARALPRGPVDVVPVESVSDARILMDGWPADRPMRLLANGEARAAWNRDYGQPGEPPPAWMDPRQGLIVDADQVPRPSNQETYHVPAEDPYVMFNVPSPQEALSIYRQNEAANVINPANTARSFLLDHATYIQMFERGRGYSPDKPAAFVDQNGRLYVDISRVDITSPSQGPGGGGGPGGGNSQAGTQVMGAQGPVGGPPPMPGGAGRATQTMGGSALMLPRQPGGGGGENGPPRGGRGEADHLQESMVGGRDNGEGGGGRRQAEGQPDGRLQPQGPRQTADVELIGRLNQEVGELVQGRGLAEGPNTVPSIQRSQAEVDLAIRILENPHSTWEATNQALQVIVERGVADYRAFRGTDLNTSGDQSGLTAANLRLMCGEGRDVTADSIASFTIGSRTPVIVHRMQAANLGIHEGQHGFNVIVLANGRGFIVDPTFAQFADQRLPGFRAGSMLSQRRGLEIARNLLRDGFMPLTEANARAYAQGLGALPGEVNAAAARIMAGDAALLTEVVVNGEVHRITTDPNEAENNIFTPREGEGDVAGSVVAIERMLQSDRLSPTDLARPLLASLRNRLIMISARQPRIEADLNAIEALKWEPPAGPETAGPEGSGPTGGPDGGSSRQPGGEAGHIPGLLMGGRADAAPDGPGGRGPTEEGVPTPEVPAPTGEPKPARQPAIPTGGEQTVGQWGPRTREVRRVIEDPEEAMRLFLEQVRAGNRNARAIRNPEILNSTWRYTFRQYTNPPLGWLDTNGNIIIDGLRVDVRAAVGREEV